MIHGDAMEIEYNAKDRGNAPRRIQCALASVEICIAQPISPAHNFDSFYIFTIKFSKSLARNFQTFQLGALGSNSVRAG